MSGVLRAGDVVARIAVFSSAVRSGSGGLIKRFSGKLRKSYQRLRKRIKKLVRPSILKKVPRLFTLKGRFRPLAGLKGALRELAAKRSFRPFSGLRSMLRPLAAKGLSGPLAVKGMAHPAAIRGAVRTAVVKGYFPIIVTLLVGVTVSIGGFAATRHYYKLAAQQEFDRQAAHYILVSRRAIDRNVETVLSSAALFAKPGGGADRWEFFEFAEKNLPQHPGIQAIAWVPRVLASERTDYVRRARDDGLYGFDITEQGADGSPVRASQRSEYFPIYYVEPFKGNAGLLGADLSVQGAYMEAFERARDTGETVAAYGAQPSVASAPPMTLLLISPVYRPGTQPNTQETRRQTLAGFAVGLFRIGNMINSTLEAFTTPAWLDLYLYEATADRGDRLLYYRPSRLRTDSTFPLDVDTVHDDLFTTETFQVADREWSIAVKPVPGKLVFEAGFMPWGFGAASLMLTMFLVMHLLSIRNRQRIIERAVVDRTAELLEATASNASLEQEIRERKRVERELRSAKDQAEVANRSKSEFLAMVSHELRTPLNAVIGFSEMLILETFGPVGDKRYAEYSEDIRNSGLHLLSLINNILDLSKVEANQFQLVDQNVDIAELISEAHLYVRDRADAVGIKIKTDVPKSLPQIYGDDRALKQILINLLSNAVKFTGRGGKVSLSAKLVSDGRLVLTVSDTGIGIAEADFKAIFQPFTQVDSSLSRQYEGTGLGLPLTKSLVELHGGELKLQSKSGVGTTVQVFLPKKRVLNQRNAAA